MPEEQNLSQPNPTIINISPPDSNGSILIPKITPDEVNIRSKNSRNKKIAIICLATIAVLILLFALPLGIFALSAKSSYQKLQPILSKESFSDIEKIKTNSKIIREEVNSISGTYKLISWMRIIPFAGVYVADLGHALKGSQSSLDAFETAFTTVQPYISILGYDNKDSGEKTAQERIDVIVSAIPEIVPKMDEISQRLKFASSELELIEPNRYPETFRGIALRNKLKEGLLLFETSTTYLENAKPVLEVAPYLLGIDNPRKYLVLFQNDKELRPTGGFMTAYSIMKVDKAKFEPVDSADIYHLDAKYKPVYPAPQPIVDLIKGPYVISSNLRLRDMNYSPDFPTGMKLFSEEVKKVGIDGMDGIIAVDTSLLVNLLNVLGEIGVSGFGNFSTKNDARCNCPQVIYELESFADTEGPIIWDPVSGKIIYTPPNYDNRKKIIGPLMNSILANAMAQPKEKLPNLIDSVFKSLMEKHVLFYVYDAKSQKALTDFGVTGNIRDYQGDYLHINDSNLGGRKSNLYVKQEVHQDIEIDKSGQITKTVAITYKNTEKHDGWLNSVLPNWVRVYVPKGSTLLASEGLEQKYEVSQDFNKTVFSGYFKLRPEGVSKVTFKYSLPFKMTGEDYQMLIQKQPGTDLPMYSITKGSYEEEFLLETDKELRINRRVN